MAFVVGAVAAMGVSAASGVAGAMIQADATKSAAQTQADAAMNASAIQKQMYEEQRSDLAPWRQAGSQALSQMGDPYFQRDFSMADFQADPGFAFRMQEGQKALERSAAARGGLQSGGTLKALAQYSQDYASNEYQNAYNRFTNNQTNRFNRLASLAGVGQTANQQLGAAGQNYANQAGSNMMGAANAGAAAQMAQGQIWGNTLSSIGSGAGNNIMMANYMNRMMPAGGAVSPPPNEVA